MLRILGYALLIPACFVVAMFTVGYAFERVIEMAGG